MSTPTVTFLDTVELVRSALLAGYVAEGETATVTSRTPAGRTTSTRFTQLTRTGGPRQTQVSDNAQITVESWGISPIDAHDLAQLNRRIILGMRGSTVDGIAVYRVAEAGGPADFPDPLSHQDRYTQLFTVAIRGTNP